MSRAAITSDRGKNPKRNRTVPTYALFFCLPTASSLDKGHATRGRRMTRAKATPRRAEAGLAVGTQSEVQRSVPRNFGINATKMNGLDKVNAFRTYLSGFLGIERLHLRNKIGFDRKFMLATESCVAAVDGVC
jgi:hypothetical protein